MKIKTAELIGSALDWAVAQILIESGEFTPAVVFGLGSIMVQRGYRRKNRHGGWDQFIGRKDCDYWKEQCDGYPFGRGVYVWEPSTTGSEVIDIMEREKMEIGWSEDGWYASMYWRGMDIVPSGAAGESFRCGADGPTLRIAVCRCYVASKLGEDVDVPEELLK